MAKETFLIVDDSRLARMMIRAFIEANRDDLEVIEAANAEEALEKASVAVIDSITLDYNMPGMNGLELAQQLQQRYPLAKMGLFTANAQDSIRKRTEDMGIIFIVKPITEEKVVEFLNA